MSDYNGKPKKKFTLDRPTRRTDDWSTRAYGEPLPGSTGNPMFFIDFSHRNKDSGKVRNIQLSVKLGLGGDDPKKEYIRLQVDQTMFKYIVDSIRDLAKNHTEYKPGFHEVITYRVDDKPFLNVDVIYGKTEQGIYIGLFKKNYPEVYCYFREPKRWDIRDMYGNILSNFEKSRRMTISIMDIWEQMIDTEYNHNYMDDIDLENLKEQNQAAARAKWSGSNGGGNNGGGNNGGGNYGGGHGGSHGNSGHSGNNPSTQNFDKDLPF